MSQLRELNEFGPTINAAAERLGISATAVEKDYWVSQAFRVLAKNYEGDFIFKGGTSLSKGYRIIERFSEDIDILVLPRTARAWRRRQADEGDGRSGGFRSRRQGRAIWRIRNRSASMLRVELPNDAPANCVHQHQRSPRDGCARR